VVAQWAESSNMMAGNPVRTRPGGRSARTRWIIAVGLAVSTSPLLLVGLLSAPHEAYAAEAPVGLGTARAYSVLGGQTVTNTGPSILNRNLGVSPGSAITGFPPGTTLGVTHAADAQAAQAQSDLVIAYNDAAGRAPTAGVAGDLVGKTLVSGVYKSTGPLALSGTLTLDGQGNANAVYIFQVASTLITASASRVSLINGARACNVYWQVGSSATLGTGSDFTGTIMALTSISVTTGTVVKGRALARNGQVSLDDNVFTTANCAAPPTSTTTSATTTTPTTSTSTTPTSTTPTTTSPTTTSPTTSPTTTSPTSSTTTSPTTTSATTTSPTSPTSPTTSITTTSSGPGIGWPGPTGRPSGGPGRGPTPANVPVGTARLASTGASPALVPLIGLGILLLVLGGVLITVGLARARSRRLR
jgi:ice-binding like protein